MRNFFRYSSRADLVILGSLTAFLVTMAMILAGGKSDSYIENRVVKLTNAHGSCSGEQVRAPSGIDYILTAAHCLPLASDGSITVTTERGIQMQRRVIAEDVRSDLLLLEGIPNLRGLDIAESSMPKEEVRTFTHGRGFATYKTAGVIIQDTQVDVPLFAINTPEDAAKCSMPKHKKMVLDLGTVVLGACFLSVTETASTAFIVPGSSGGMLVDPSGDLVGVVSAGDGSFGYFVTLSDIKTFLRNY